MDKKQNKKASVSKERAAIMKSLREASKYAKKLAEQTGTKFIVAKPVVKKKKRAA